MELDISLGTTPPKPRRQKFVVVPSCPEYVDQMYTRVKQFIHENKLTKEVEGLKIQKNSQLQKEITLECSRRMARILCRTPGVKELREIA